MISPPPLKTYNANIIDYSHGKFINYIYNSIEYNKSPPLKTPNANLIDYSQGKFINHIYNLIKYNKSPPF